MQTRFQSYPAAYTMCSFQAFKVMLGHLLCQWRSVRVKYDA